MIIGLAGKARAGKTTAADYISAKYEIPTYAFADPLKAAACQLFGIAPQMAYGTGGYDREQIVPQWGISVREMLQKLGSECMRMNFGADFWTKRAEIVTNQHRHLIISDVRFDNEADWVKSKAGIVINITRESSINSSHASERGVSKTDHQIENNGNAMELFNKIDEILMAYGI